MKQTSPIKLKKKNSLHLILFWKMANFTNSSRTYIFWGAFPSIFSMVWSYRLAGVAVIDTRVRERDLLPTQRSQPVLLSWNPAPVCRVTEVLTRDLRTIERTLFCAATAGPDSFDLCQIK